ncbi:Zn-dependent exopeptidase [Mycena leptocephala]|nr:Zn-dependent exopeptidase [Mycena leptocephala]
MISLAGTLLLVTPFAPALFDSCLSDSYYGNYNDGQTTNSVFMPDAACIDSWLSQTLAAQDIYQLVWVEQEAVEPSLITATRSFRNEFDSFLQRLTAPKRPKIGYELLYRTPTAALLSVSERQLGQSTLSPPLLEIRSGPPTPVSFMPVPEEALDHVKYVLSTLKFNPEVASIVDSISVPQMINDIRFLTGEDGVRESCSRTAASWLKDRFEDTGATCELQPFLVGFAPNVSGIAYPSTFNTTATVLLSAHYDSRGSFGSTRAPGGDDDGSGTMAILASPYYRRKGIKFQSNVQLVAFAGEEQGLLGSKAYARKAPAMHFLPRPQIADMLAYRAEGEPPQLGLPQTIGTTEVTQLVANVSAIYSPELRVGFTPACCSDHQSFHEQGFPATQVFERAGMIADPMYHNSGDLSDREGYDFDQVKSIAKVQLATLLHAAGYELRKLIWRLHLPEFAERRATGRKSRKSVIGSVGRT